MVGFAALRLGVELDGVDDFHVARATAQVGVDGLGDFVSRRTRVLVAEVLGAQGEAGDAKAALQAAADDEGSTEQRAVGVRQPFEGHNLLALDLFGVEGAGRLGLSVHQREAAAALALGLATVFGRDHAAAVSQCVEE